MIVLDGDFHSAKPSKLHRFSISLSDLAACLSGKQQLLNFPDDAAIEQITPDDETLMLNIVISSNDAPLVGDGCAIPAFPLKARSRERTLQLIAEVLSKDVETIQVRE